MDKSSKKTSKPPKVSSSISLTPAQIEAIMKFTAAPIAQPVIDPAQLAEELSWAIANNDNNKFNVLLKMFKQYSIDINQLNFGNITPIYVGIDREKTKFLKQIFKEFPQAVNGIPKYQPLMFAIVEKKDAIFKMLLEIPEINLNAVCEEDHSALYYAAHAGSLEMVTILIEKIMQGKMIFHQPLETLGVAVLGENWESVNALLKMPQFKDIINIPYFKNRNNIDITFLISIIYKNQNKTTSWINQLLCHKIFDVNAPSSSGGLTPLMAACETKSIKVIKELCNHPDIKINACDSDGFSALLFNSTLKSPEVLSILLSHPDIDVNIRDNLEKCTPLHRAVSFNDIDLVRRLLKHPKINPNVEEKNQLTPLALACRFEYTAIIEELLKDNRILVDKNTEKKFTPLHLASFSGKLGAVDILLKDSRFQHQLDMFNDENMTPLMLACQLGHSKTVAKLISCNVNINLKTNIGGTALMIAILYGHVEVVKQLLQQPNIEINAQDMSGFSALDIVCAFNDITMAEILITHPDIEINRALLVADFYQHSALKEFLLKIANSRPQPILTQNVMPIAENIPTNETEIAITETAVSIELKNQPNTSVIKEAPEPTVESFEPVEHPQKVIEPKGVQDVQHMVDSFDKNIIETYQQNYQFRYSVPSQKSFDSPSDSSIIMLQKVAETLLIKSDKNKDKNAKQIAQMMQNKIAKIMGGEKNGQSIKDYLRPAVLRNDFKDSTRVLWLLDDPKCATYNKHFDKNFENPIIQVTSDRNGLAYDHRGFFKFRDSSKDIRYPCSKVTFEFSRKKEILYIVYRECTHDTIKSENYDLGEIVPEQQTKKAPLNSPNNAAHIIANK